MVGGSRWEQVGEGWLQASGTAQSCKKHSVLLLVLVCHPWACIVGRGTSMGGLGRGEKRGDAGTRKSNSKDQRRFVTKLKQVVSSLTVKSSIHFEFILVHG